MFHTKFLTLLLFLLFTSTSFGERINNIDISGLQKISRGTVLSYLPIESGDEYNAEIRNSSISKLLESNFFESVEITLLDNNLQIKVSENPTLLYLDFLNYEEDLVLSEKIIENLKQNYSLNIGDFLNKKNIEELKDALVLLYQNSGFYEATIKTRINVDSLNRAGVEIDIEEGEPTLIKSMTISGNKAFSDEDLLGLFNIGEPDFFLINYFTNKDKFNLNEFKAGIEKIKNKYFEAGYLNFKFIKQNVKITNENYFNIEIEVSEGKKFSIASVSLKGDLSERENEKLSKELSVKVGDNLNRSEIIKSSKKISEYYQNEGYAFANIQAKLNPSPEDASLDLNINVTKDVKVYINRINISGNNKTQDDVIRRESQILEGQLYSLKEIKNSINLIKRLGFFSDVKYDIKRLANSDDKVDINIEVVETKTGEFTIGLSHSNAIGPSLNAGISQSNILGTGNTFNGEFSNSSAVQEYSFFFSNPYFNNEKTTISYGLFDKSLDAANIDTSSYTLNESGLILGYGFNTNQDSRIYSELRGSSVSIVCGSDLLIYEAADCSKDDTLDINLTSSFSRNTLNDYFFPTDGSNDKLSLSLGLPIGDITYYKFDANHRNYIPLTEKYTFKLSGRLGYAAGLGGDSLPFYKRYYEGGSSSVRGFDFNSLGERYTNLKPKGGELSIVSSTSIITPFNNFFDTENENMRLSAFIDAGSLTHKLENFDSNDIRVSSGIEFSWLTPIGPIALFYAEPVIKKDSDSIERFSFQLGTSF